MAEMTSYEHGVPSWVDMGAKDPKTALAFYQALFGWEAADMGEEMGNYTILSKNGKQVAAISGAQDPGPPRWSTYVNVESAEEVSKKVEEAGGSVLFGPTEVMGEGTMAVFQDTTGAVISAWQPARHLGAQLVNEAGALTWNELSTSDLSKSKEFYSAVFGWGWGGADEYAEAQVNGRTIGGVMPRRPEQPAEVPDHWLVYFGTADVDGDTGRATGLGATVLVEPTDIPGTGRFSVVADPEGGVFALFQA